MAVKPTTKWCVTCHIEKPLEAFYSDPKGLFGRTGTCRDCSVAKRRKQSHLVLEYSSKNTHSIVPVPSIQPKSRLVIVRSSYKNDPTSEKT